MYQFGMFWMSLKYTLLLWPLVCKILHFLQFLILWIQINHFLLFFITKVQRMTSQTTNNDQTSSFALRLNWDSQIMSLTVRHHNNRRISFIKERVSMHKGLRVCCLLLVDPRQEGGDTCVDPRSVPVPTAVPPGYDPSQLPHAVRLTDKRAAAVSLDVHKQMTKNCSYII